VTIELCQQLKAPNDRNGNPQRVWVVYAIDEGDGLAFPVETINEGYGGIPEKCRELIRLLPVEVSTKEYKAWLKK